MKELEIFKTKGTLKILYNKIKEYKVVYFAQSTTGKKCFVGSKKEEDANDLLNQYMSENVEKIDWSRLHNGGIIKGEGWFFVKIKPDEFDKFIKSRITNLLHKRAKQDLIEKGKWNMFYQPVITIRDEDIKNYVLKFGKISARKLLDVDI